MARICVKYSNPRGTFNFIHNISRFFLEAEALLVLKDILSGLKEMVSQNVIHRDLKPANIIKHNNSYKITDFGFSRSFEKFDMM